jgi:hypothetical protein
LTTELDTEWHILRVTLRSMSISRRQVVARQAPSRWFAMSLRQPGTSGSGIEDERRSEEHADLPGLLGHQSNPLWVSFRAKNAFPHDLLAVFPELSKECVPLTSTELDALFRGRFGWWRFRWRHPLSRGVVRLSRVAFDESLSQALICCGRQSGPLSGAGWYRLFRRISGEWRQTGSTLAWMS